MYVDVHKAIRRLAPAPRAKRIHQAEAAAVAAAAKRTNDSSLLVDIAENSNEQTIRIGSYGAGTEGEDLEEHPRTAIYMKRRGSAGVDGRPAEDSARVKTSLDEVKRQIRLGPANRAANPKTARKDNIFKIKHGIGSPHLGPQKNGTPVFRTLSVDRPPLERSRSEVPSASSERTPLLGESSLSSELRNGKDAETDADKKK